MDEIPNDEQITDETSFLEHAEFVIESLKQFSVGRCALAVAFAQALITKLAQITLARFSSGHRIFRIFRTPKLKIEMTTLADFERVHNCLWEFAEDFMHFGR